MNRLKKLERERAKAARTGERTVEEFNRLVPIGTDVEYWKGRREGVGRRSRTRSEAKLLGGHTPVVWVEHEPACLALTHVQVIGGGR